MTTGTPERDYKSYDYKQAVVKERQASFCIDCYENFGWKPDENRPMQIDERGQSRLWLKRDKNIADKAELTRLERHFDACLSELAALEHSKTARPMIAAMICGLIGTVFVAGATFAATAQPPVIWLSILLTVPGFLGWILPYFIYRAGVAKRTAAVAPFIENKYTEIDEICKKGHSLL